MCCASNHQNNVEMTQWNISLSISPFLVIYANTSKSNSKYTNIPKRAKESEREIGSNLFLNDFGG
jgi:hypothetical protein